MSKARPEKPDDPPMPVDIDEIKTAAEVEADEKAIAEMFIQRAAPLVTEITNETKLTNAKRACVGCLCILGRRQLQSVKDDKTKTEILDELLAKWKVKPSTMYKYMSFARQLNDANIITSQMLADIEKEEKATPDFLKLLEKGVNSKRGIEIQEKMGYLPSSKSDEAKIPTLQDRLVAELEAAQKSCEKLAKTRMEMADAGIVVADEIKAVIDKSADTVKAISNLQIVKDKVKKLKANIASRKKKAAVPVQALADTTKSVVEAQH